MAIVSDADGREIQTHAGIQPRQYLEQLRAAGMLTEAIAATGTKRRRLQHAASRLVHALRRGEVSTESKAAAAQLGLQHYPDGIRSLPCSPSTK